MFVRRPTNWLGFEGPSGQAVVILESCPVYRRTFWKTGGSLPSLATIQGHQDAHRSRTVHLVDVGLVARRRFRLSWGLRDKPGGRHAAGGAQHAEVKWEQVEG